MSIVENYVFPSLPNPFYDLKINENMWMRTFDPNNTMDSEFIWHRDKKEREVEVIASQDWQFQFDNELPFRINSLDKFKIPKMVYHRIIPGKGKLNIKIIEFN